MKEYSAHFSFYSEQYGSFEEAIIKVDAANQFEARSKAWELSADNVDLEFASCIKLCGITWDASKLDMQDYFNSAASYEKFLIQRIENIEKPNAQIEKNNRGYDDCERERYSNYGSLHTISAIAGDLGKPLGMLPPVVFEELHYAREFAYTLDYKENDKCSAMLKQIERAEKWDSSAIFSIQELFRNGYGLADGHELDFSVQFGKDGIYPVHADRSDYANRYVNRWNNEREYKGLATLPLFGEKDVIANSRAMQYEGHTLVIKMEALPPDKQTPVNSLWVSKEISQGDKGSDTPMTAENLLTGEIAEWKRSDFHGILRPEKSTKIDNEVIKIEYHSLNNKEIAKKSIEGKKPSILADVREKEKGIAAQNSPAVQKNKQASKDEL